MSGPAHSREPGLISTQSPGPRTNPSRSRRMTPATGRSSAGWLLSVMLQSNIKNHHVSILNNKIHDNPGTSGGKGHGLIDLASTQADGANGKLEDILIEGNQLFEGFIIMSAYGGNVILRYTDKRKICEDGKGSPQTYPDRTEYVTVGDEMVRIKVGSACP